MDALSLGHLEDEARATEYRNDVPADYKTELEGSESWRLAIGAQDPEMKGSFMWYFLEEMRRWEPPFFPPPR